MKDHVLGLRLVGMVGNASIDVNVCPYGDECVDGGENSVR